ncbi:MAG: SPASM domain-containing protein [Candidatus Edwardsbacteria bacterium]|jgi:MoaA/NifB/PqqE/SkfB family radical SAM enzyme|nr:SPASM domain-containing protein [Candidatus Edwardsbacteria bacterium]
MISPRDHLRGIGYRLLASPIVGRNRIYRACYAGRIASVQRRGLSFPRVVAIEGTNRCNAACVMCGHRTMRRAQGVMAWPLYQRLIAQLRGTPVETVLLSGFGEPLCDPDLVRRVAAAKAAGLPRVGIVTNAALLAPPAAGALAAAGLDLVHVSLDGASAATYGRLRPGLDFDIVTANLDYLLGLRPRPAVHIQMTLFEENRRDARLLERRWRGRAERLIFRQAQDWAGQVDIPAPAYSPHLRDSDAVPPCRYLWNQINIYWDGTVPLCCLDFEAAQPVGDAARQTLADIWQGPALQAIRGRHQEGRRGEVPLCRGCRYFPVWW